MKGRFSKFFAVTALLLSICCLSAASVSVHANAFDNVRTNVTQTQHTTTKKVSQHYSVKFEIADASFAILTQKQRTVLNTREPIEKVQKIINKHKEEIKKDQNCIVMLQK